MDGKVIGITIKVTPHTEEFDVIPRVYYGEKLNAVSVRSIKPLVVGPHKIERLHPPGTKLWYYWFLRKLNEYTISTFITLYNLGFKKIMVRVIVFILFISLIHMLYARLRKIKRDK